MKHSREFPFDKARRITAQEVGANRRAIQKKLGEKRLARGRPPKAVAEKYKAVAIRLHPKILQWAREQGKKKGLGYQTIINRILLKIAA